MTRTCGMCLSYTTTFAGIGVCNAPTPVVYQLLIEPMTLETTDAECCPCFRNNPNYHDEETLLDEKMRTNH